MTNAAVLGAGLYVPEKILTNRFFIEENPIAYKVNGKNFYKVYIGQDENGEPIYKQKDGKDELSELTDEIIIKTTGIKERRKSAENEFSSDMAVKASQKAMKNAKLLPSDLEGIIIATISPDNDANFPSTASRVQSKLGAMNVSYGHDLAAACAGFGYALEIANQRIKSGAGKHLIIGVENLTRITDYEERNCDLFGDGAGALILGPTEQDKGILKTKFYNDPFDGKMDYIYRDRKGKLRMPKGPQVFKYAVVYMKKCAAAIKQEANLSEEQISLYIPHQANINIIKKIKEELGDKVYNNIENYGNMSSATCPIALAEAIEKGRLKENDVVIMVSFGSGLSVSGAAIKL
jgi:3-oxoacyl-[acyl-carrier-protein] synthase-3